MKIILFLIAAFLIPSGFAGNYVIHFIDDYYYVVTVKNMISDSVYLALKSDNSFRKIPQTIQLDNSSFSILCDLYATDPSGATMIGLANVKDVIRMSSRGVPSIGGKIGTAIDTNE